MPRANVLSTALDLAPSRAWLSSLRRSHPAETERSSQLDEPSQRDPELKLPPIPSLVIVLSASTLLQVCHRCALLAKLYSTRLFPSCHSSSSYPRRTPMLNISEEHPPFPVWSSVSRPYSQGLRYSLFSNSIEADIRSLCTSLAGLHY